MTFFSTKALPSVETIRCSFIYALLLVSAQWCYTVSLEKINLAICSTIYSLGFVIPTLSGMLFWNEPFGGLDLAGLALVMCAVFMSGYSSSGKKRVSHKGGFWILIIAMLSSGGLGFAQKLQQMSSYREETGQFVAMAFFIAAFLSFAVSAFCKKGENKMVMGAPLSAVVVGICFGACNLLNTTLAGRLDSAVFFPLQNISVIFLSTVLVLAFHKERFSRTSTAVLAVGAIAIVLLNI